jgi:hypothetical protein
VSPLSKKPCPLESVDRDLKCACRVEVLFKSSSCRSSV